MRSRSSSGNSLSSSTNNNTTGGGYSSSPQQRIIMPSSPSPIRLFIRKQLSRVSTGFASLSNSPSELWKAYLLKFLDSYAYFSFALVFTIFLSDDFGMSDIQAGSVYGAWGAMITIFGLVTGTVIDNLGVAKCLRIGFVLSFLSRVVIFATASKEVLLVCLLITLPFSNCLGIPVLTVGIRRYTNDVNRGFAFGLFYCVMNVGALLAGPLVDALTVYYNDKESADGTDIEAADVVAGSSPWVMNANRAIILSGLVANFIAVFVAFTVREIKVDANAKEGSPKMPQSSSNERNENNGGEANDLLSANQINGEQEKISTFRPVQASSYQILSETARDPNFRRFLLVCLLMINVRMVFRHLDGTLPKYMVREFGENTPKGRVYAINPAIIIILVPIITAATTAVDPLVMIHWGTYVSALSVFFLAFSTSVHACVFFVITLSIGEAIWSPRLYDYTMSIAQEGREGTYMALSSAPLFLAKLPVGFMSGFLLERYCPEHLEEGEERHSKTMWLIIGLSTLVSPILITLLWGYISGGKEGGSTRGNGTGAMSRGDRLMGDNGEGSVMEDDSEHSYQHHPLETKMSLPRVRSHSERPLV